MLDPDVLPKVAVVPFEYRGEQKDHLDVVGEILANNVITLLSRSMYIKVISRLSTTKLRYTEWSYVAAKDLLGCDYVLFGSYTVQINKLYIVFRLSRVSDEQELWADEFQCSLQDIIATDSALVEHLASTAIQRIVGATLNGTRLDSLGGLETHALYINGLNHMHGKGAEEFQLSRACFVEIAERQPHHSTVQALLSLWHLLQTQRNGGWELRDRDENAAIIRHYIGQSLELNPGNEYALALKGSIEVYLSKDVELGLELVNQVVSSNQNDPRIQSISSMVFMAARQYNEAVVCIEKSIELSPLDPQLEFFYALAAGAHYHKGRYTLAEQYAQRSIDINPDHTSPLRTMIATNVAVNEFAMAKENAERLMKIEPNFTVDSWLKHWSGNVADGNMFAAHLLAAGIPKR